MPDAQHLDAGEGRERSAAGDGVDPRRRIPGRRRRRDRATTARRSRARTSSSSRSTTGSASSASSRTRSSPRSPAATRRATTACSIRSPRLQWVQGQHCRVRRRSRQRHDLRRVGGIVCGQRADGVAARAGPLPQGDWRKRRLLRRPYQSRFRSNLARLVEQDGVKFAAALGAESLAALRAKTGDEVLKVALKTQPWFSPNLDGYFLTEVGRRHFCRGQASPRPAPGRLECRRGASGYRASASKSRPRKASSTARASSLAIHADAILKAYPAATDAEALESAASLESDLFIGYSTWKWIEVHQKTGKRRCIATRSIARSRCRPTTR